MNIWIAASDGNLAVVKKFIEEENYNPNSKDQNGYTPIHAAAAYGHVDLLKYLIENGGDINICDEDGDTPLHAVEDSATAQVLLDLGASLTIKNEEDLTALDKAIQEEEFPELIEFLRKASGEEIEALPENVSVRVNYEPEEEEGNQVTEEQREELRRIVENGNDNDLEGFLSRVLGAPSSSSAKKAHTE